MSVIIFKLKGVPDDEAEEVRDLLGKNNLDYYETSAGRWRLGMAAIWLEDEAQLERAKKLIQEYQIERSLRIRAEYEKLKREGKLETIIDRMKREPIQFIFYLAVILSIVYFSIKPFIDIGK